MADKYKIQLSLKRGEDILVIGAENAHEFKSLANELSELSELNKFFPPSKVSAQEPTITQAPPPSEVGAKVSALEIARQRMRGGQ